MVYHNNVLKGNWKQITNGRLITMTNTKELNIFLTNTDWRALDQQVADVEMDLLCAGINK